MVWVPFAVAVTALVFMALTSIAPLKEVGDAA